MNARTKHLLFLLMRDHLPVGTLRGVMVEVEFAGPLPFSADPGLAAIAEALALRLDATAPSTISQGLSISEAPTPIAARAEDK